MSLLSAAVVAVSSATKKFDREYKYLVPEGLIDIIGPGFLAFAPFGAKNANTHVIVLKMTTAESGDGLKYISSIPWDEPLVSDGDIRLAEYMRGRYNCTWFDAFKCMLPKGWAQKSRQGAARRKKIKSKAQEEAQPGAADAVGTEQNIEPDAAPIGAKEKDPYGDRTFELLVEFVPTDEQADVIDRINLALDQGGFREMLLHGVTGGGKTEVYMQVIKDVIARGKDAIVLVPEISLTPQMVERFKGRFPGNVAVFHSRLSEGERQDQWRRVKDQKVSIAVGARSAVFAPFNDIGIIIIDEEHESSYKSESTPRYHAAEIAAERCKRNGALLLYGSATPSVERYYSAKSGKIELLTIYKRTNFLDLPVVDVVDLRDELKSGNRKMFSRKLIIEIEKNIQNGEQTILFLNRRGYSPFVLCRSCGYIVTCKNCSVSYTYHSDTEKLICHYCGAAARLPGKCPVCESLDIKLFGAGTQRVEEEVKKLFNGCSVIRMDRDTTSAKNSHERILNEFVKKKIDILIGTQMIAKGHDFPNVTLVGVLAADPMLNINDFRSAERAFQLLMQVSGRAGRGKIRGRVVIQTYNPDHYSIATSMEHDYNSFYRQEIMVRRELEYPPFKSIGAVMLSGPDDKKTFDAALALHTKCREEHSGDDGIVITKPLRPPIGVIKDKYRWRFIIKHGDTNKLAQILGELGDFFFSGKLPKDAELGVDINPNSMM